METRFVAGKRVNESRGGLIMMMWSGGGDYRVVAWWEVTNMFREVGNWGEEYWENG